MVTYEEYQKEWLELYRSGLTMQEIADKYGCSRSTVGKYLHQTDLDISKAAPPEVRFWRYVNKRDDGIWEWTGGTGRGGYGQFWYQGRTIVAHRYSWILHNGEIEDGLLVLHKNDTPWDVNPDHLFLGTQADNMADMVQKGRSLKGEANHDAKLSVQEVRAIKRIIEETEVSFKDIGDEHGVHRRAIRQIADGESWTHVQPAEANGRELRALVNEYLPRIWQSQLKSCHSGNVLHIGTESKPCLCGVHSQSPSSTAVVGDEIEDLRSFTEKENICKTCLKAVLPYANPDE